MAGFFCFLSFFLFVGGGEGDSPCSPSSLAAPYLWGFTYWQFCPWVCSLESPAPGMEMNSGLLVRCLSTGEEKGTWRPLHNNRMSVFSMLQSLQCPYTTTSLYFYWSLTTTPLGRLFRLEIGNSQIQKFQPSRDGPGAYTPAASASLLLTYVFRKKKC